MINEEKVIVCDIDGTLTDKNENKEYSLLTPNAKVVKKLKEYHKNGYSIIFYTSRQMRTHKGNIGRINATTLKEILKWLDENDIPYEEVHVGKPWCGFKGFYVDDKAIRPDEFINFTENEIAELIK